MVRCPVCFNYLEALTNVHCMKCHQMTKQQVIESYGKPEYVHVPAFNKEMPVSYVTSKRDYINSQLFNDRVRSKTRKFHTDRG